MSGLQTSCASRHATCARPSRAPQSAQDVLIGTDDGILAEIEAPGVAATIWQRRADPAIEAWLSDLPADQLPQIRTSVPVDLVETAVLTACSLVGTPPGAMQDILASDVAALATMFCRIMKAKDVRLRLDVSHDVTCPRFHRDNVPARLLCTYRGAGTEYVTDARQEDKGRIRTMRPFAVGLFRGEKWPSAEPCRLLHRSPPDKGPRLLLVIDAT